MTWLAPDQLLFLWRAEEAEKDELFEDSMVCGKTEVWLYSEAGLVRYTLTGDIPNPGFQDMQPSWTPNSWALVTMRNDSCNLKIAVITM